MNAADNRADADGVIDHQRTMASVVHLEVIRFFIDLIE